MRHFTSLLLAAALFAGVPPLANAEPSAADDDSLAWPLLSAELATAGVLALKFGVRGWANDGPASLLSFTPLLLGAGLGGAAYYGNWDTRPAYAIQGASMVGLELFLLGSLIDGRNEDDGLRVGPSAWILGTVGATAGAYLGATQIGNADEGDVFFSGPVGGFVFGGLIVGGSLALMADDSSDVGQRLVIGAVGGLGVGLAGSLYYALTHSDSEPDELSPTAFVPTLGPRTAILSFSGAF